MFSGDKERKRLIKTFWNSFYGWEDKKNMGQVIILCCFRPPPPPSPLQYSRRRTMCISVSNLNVLSTTDFGSRCQFLPV